MVQAPAGHPFWAVVAVVLLLLLAAGLPIGPCTPHKAQALLGLLALGCLLPGLQTARRMGEPCTGPQASQVHNHPSLTTCLEK